MFRRSGVDVVEEDALSPSRNAVPAQPLHSEEREDSAVASRPAVPATPVTQTVDRSVVPPSPSQTVDQVIAPIAPTQSVARVISPAVARFADASIPVSQRMSEIDQLGQRGDAESVQTLMQLGDTYTYLNFQAIEALGRVKTAEVARYLAGKTHDKDPKIVAGAMQSLAQVQGAEGIPVIAATIAANRQRPDGFQDTVCAAGVKALGEIGSPQAIPALAEEFEKTVGKTLQHEYGSQVVAAFKAIGDPAGVPALEAYAQRLQTQRDAMAKNPMGQHYLEEKIKEVREAIASLVK
jgi:HEAT repeat protein